MCRRRYLIYAVIAAIIGTVIFGCYMFFGGMIAASQNEVQVSSAVPAAVAGLPCTCGGTMSRIGTTAATCTSPGTEIYKCGSCGKTNIVELSDSPALGHSEVTDEAVPATCTTAGLTEGSHCSRCGEVFEAQETILALGHETVVQSAVVPTCTQSGLTEGSYCSRCSTIFSVQEIVPALGHSWSDWEDSRTNCDEAGNRTRSCSVCGEEEIEELPAGTHSWDYGTVIKQPDCTQPGTIQFTCTMCGDTSTDDIEPLGHNLTHHAASEPTKDNEGNIEYWQCKRCGKYFSDKDGTIGIAYSDISVPYTDDSSDTGGMPLWQIILAVASGILLFSLICAAASKLLSRKNV